MIPVLIIIMGLSILGMVALLSIKRYELNTGRLFLGSARPVLGGIFHATIVWFRKTLPAFLRHYLRTVGSYLNTRLHQLLARLVVFVEHTLEKVLHVVREKTEPDPNQHPGEVSPFLREVAEHKKNLLRRPRRKKTFEE